MQKFWLQLRDVLKLSTRSVPQSLGLKVRKVILAHYRLSLYGVSSKKEYINTSSNLCMILKNALSSKETNPNRIFFERYIEMEYEYLNRLNEITKKNKAKTISYIEKNKDLTDIYFVGSKWIEQVERVGNDIGIELPTFADFAVNAPRIEEAYKVMRDPNDFISLLNENDVKDAAERYADYKYANNVCHKK